MHRVGLRSAPLLLVLLLSSGAVAETVAPTESTLRANRSGRGLLDVRDPMPLAQLHLQAPVQAEMLLPRGATQLEFNFTWANTYARSGVYHVDAESYDMRFGAWHALRERWYLGAELPVWVRGGGVLDSLVEAFHDAFGIDSGDRDQFPRNDYQVDFVLDDGARARIPGSAELGDLVLKVHWNAWDGGRILPALSLQGLVSLPTSTSDFGKNGVDVGATLGLSKIVLQRVELSAVFSGLYASDPRISDLRFERWGWQATAGIGVSIVDRLSVVGQYTAYSPLLRDRPTLDEGRNYITVGVKWGILRQLWLELAFIENLAPFSNSSDLGFVFAFDWRF